MRNNNQKQYQLQEIDENEFYEIDGYEDVIQPNITIIHNHFYGDISHNIYVNDKRK